MTTQPLNAIERAKRNEAKKAAERAERDKRINATVTGMKPEAHRVLADLTNKPEDQKDVPAGKSGDQNDAPVKAKKERKQSETVTLWKAQKDALPANAKITVKPEYLASNPKKRGAGVRFSWYKNGQSVAEYCKLSKDNGHSGAESDVKWDIAAGFITIEV